MPNATTNFVNDGDTAYAAPYSHADLHDSLVKSGRNAQAEDIVKFLAKPIPIQLGNFSVADTSAMLTTTVMTVMQSHVTAAPAADKLKGFFGIKATQVFRLVVNGQRFQQGRYIMAWIPYGGSGGLAKFTVATKMRAYDLTTITQLPHVEIDINTQTEAILEVPYTSVYSHYPLNNTDPTTWGFLGQVFLYPYSALTTPSGSTTASYTVYSSLKDVSLAAPAFPQSNIAITTTERKASGITGVTESSLKPSHFAKVASGALNYIGDNIPTVSWFTRPAAWAASVASGVLAAFGWSNPIDIAPVTRALQTIFPYANNCDAVDSSMPLSLTASNEVELLTGNGSPDRDEMVIDYIKTIPAYTSGFNLSTADTQGLSVYNTSLSPGNFFNTYFSGGATFKTMPPIGFLASIFDLYRGSIRFTFKIVKTEFHSGRYAIQFNPYEVRTGTPALPGNAGGLWLHREIIDIRECSEFTYVVPWTSLSTYKPTSGNGWSYGSLQIVCINPLVGPVTVSSTVRVLVEVSAAPDMEFAVPTQIIVAPIIPVAPQSNITLPSNNNLIASGTIGSSSTDSEDLIPARVCIGEKITSLLQVAKSNDIMLGSGSANKTNTFFPYAVPTVHALAVLGPTYCAEQPPVYQVIQSLYLYSRGGVRIRSLSSRTTAYTSDAVINCQMRSAPNGVAAYYGMLSTATQTVWSHTLNCLQWLRFRAGVEVQVPMYHRFHSRINTDLMYAFNGNASNLYYDVDTFPTTPRVQLQITSDIATQMSIGMQVADDYHCSFFLGIPPLIETSVNNVPP